VLVSDFPGGHQLLHRSGTHAALPCASPRSEDGGS
jgi:hypothetical protein